MKTNVVTVVDTNRLILRGTFEKCSGPNIGFQKNVEETNMLMF